MNLFETIKNGKTKQLKLSSRKKKLNTIAEKTSIQNENTTVASPSESNCHFSGPSVKRISENLNRERGGNAIYLFETNEDY